MRMTCSSLCNIYENVDMIRYEAFVIVVKTKGVPRQRQRKWCHGNIPVPVTRLRYRCKGEVCGCVQKMVGAPGFRVSHDLATRKRVTNWTQCKHEHLKHRKHSFTDVVSGLYL